jgi:hypothetical protein
MGWSSGLDCASGLRLLCPSMQGCYRGMSHGDAPLVPLELNFAWATSHCPNASHKIANPWMFPRVMGGVANSFWMVFILSTIFILLVFPSCYLWTISIALYKINPLCLFYSSLVTFAHCKLWLHLLMEAFFFFRFAPLMAV